MAIQNHSMTITTKADIPAQVALIKGLFLASGEFELLDESYGAANGNFTVGYIRTGRVYYFSLADYYNSYSHWSGWMKNASGSANLLDLGAIQCNYPSTTGAVLIYSDRGFCFNHMGGAVIAAGKDDQNDWYDIKDVTAYISGTDLIAGTMLFTTATEKTIEENLILIPALIKNSTTVKVISQLAKIYSCPELPQTGFYRLITGEIGYYKSNKLYLLG